MGGGLQDGGWGGAAERQLAQHFRAFIPSLAWSHIPSAAD